MDSKLYSDIPGLDNLSQALLEASEIEKCSICMENLQDTVLLWPCSHHFCKKCLSGWRASSSGGNVSCPLCNGSADRRRVLNFEAEQKKRADVFHRLVGAISLDLGFDITTYKRCMGSDQPLESKGDFSSYQSPVKKTVKAYPSTRKQVAKKPVPIKTGSTKNKKNPLTVANLPTEVFEGDTRDKKVKEWLDATKFSQVCEENLKETIVADVHAPDSELTALSEEQFKSVTQVDSESLKVTFKHKRKIKHQDTPDLDDIRPFDETTKCKTQKQTKEKTLALPDEFDNLLPQKKKRQLVKCTYGGKNQPSNRRSKRFLPVDSDIFNSVVVPVDQNTESDVGKLDDSSQATLEDFSSGSGEEWVADSKREKQHLKVQNSFKRNSKECLERKVTRRSARISKPDKSKSECKSKNKILEFAQRNDSDSKSASSNIAKKLEAAFTNTKSQNVVEEKTIKLYEVDGSAKVTNPSIKLFDPVLSLKPIQRSPGWSRLTTTKKEFHMSEKKKLSLKTLNSSMSRSTSDISPGRVEDQIVIESSKRGSNENVATKNPSPLKENVPTLNAKEEHSFSFLDIDNKRGFGNKYLTSKSENVFDRSSTSIDSPFKGFLTTKLNKDVNSVQNVEGANNTLCKDDILKKDSLADTNKTGVNITELPSNGCLVSEKCRDKFNLSKSNILDIKSNSTENIIPTVSLLTKDYKGESGRNDLEGLELNHDAPCPFLYKENTLISLKENNKEDVVVNLHSVSSDQVQQCNLFNDGEISNSLCPQGDKEEILGYQSNSMLVKDLSHDKKRSRETTPNSNRSPFGSPLGKRFCQDVQTQTSPARTESFLDDYIKIKYGIDKTMLVELATNHKNIERNQENLQQPVNKRNRIQGYVTTENKFCKTNLFQDSGINNTKGNQDELSLPVNEPNTVKNHLSTEIERCKSNLSQDSDKENTCLSPKFLNDSDIVLGTEDCVRHNLDIVNHKFKCPTMQIKHDFSALADIEIKDNEVDPDAPTQPYKTPVAAKLPIQTVSSLLYSVVSNPTDSELKQVNDVFLKDELYLNDTPKSVTPWNGSGIKELESCTIKVNKDVDLIYKPNPSQKLKEKCNKSRRQLDFIEEDSQSNDMFDTVVGNEAVSETMESIEPNLFVKTTAIDNEEDNVLLHEKPTLEQPVHNETPNKCSVPVTSNSLQTASINNTSNDNNIQVNTFVENRLSIPQSNHLRHKINVSSYSEISGNKLQDKVTNPFVRSTSKVHPFINTNKKNTCRSILKKTSRKKPMHVSRPIIIHNVSNKSFSFKGNILHRHTFLQTLITLNGINGWTVSSSQSKIKEKKLDDDQVSNASDYFIEGTPDPSQVEMHPTSDQSEGKEKTQSSFTKLENSADNQACCEKGNNPWILNNQADSYQEDKPMTQPLKNNTTPSNTVMSEDFGETEEDAEENYCFSSSLLNALQNRKLQKALKMFDIPFSKTVNADISHLVVGTINRRTQNSYKFLYAMALHKYIISFDWVEDVLVAKPGQTVALKPYLALDPSGECGVLRAIVDKKRILLQDFAVHIYNVAQNIVTKKQIEELVQLCGGTVVPSLPHFLSVPRDKFRIIVISEPTDTLTQTDWRVNYNTAEVSVDWIYNTIGRYRVVPLLQFMVDQPDAVQFLRHQGYPENLIFDPSSQH